MSRNNSTALVWHGDKKRFRFDYARSGWPVTSFHCRLCPYRPPANCPARRGVSGSVRGGEPQVGKPK